MADEDKKANPVRDAAHARRDERAEQRDARKDARDDAKDARQAAEQALKDGADEKQRIVDEQEKRAANAKPTPTQEEADRAKLGIPQELEDDGSGPDPSGALHEPKQYGFYSTRELPKK